MHLRLLPTIATVESAVPVFGNSFAPAFLAGVAAYEPCSVDVTAFPAGTTACEPCSADVTALSAEITAVVPSGKVTVVVPSLPTLTSVAVGLIS